MDDLVTARLVLHPMTVSEAEQVVAGESASGARWGPGYPTDGDVSAARRFLGTCATTGDPQPFGNYEVRRREDGAAIGGVGFHGAPDEEGASRSATASSPQREATDTLPKLSADCCRSRGHAASPA